MGKERTPRPNEAMPSGEAGRGCAVSRLQPLADHPRQAPSEHSEKASLSPFMKSVVMRSLKLLSVFCSFAMFALCWEAFYPAAFDGFPNVGADFILWALYMALIIAFGRIYHAYEVGMYRVSELVYSQSLADFFSAGIVYVVASIARFELLNPLALLALVLVQGLWNAAWSVTANGIFFRIHPPLKSVIIYRQASDLRKLEQIRYFSSKYDVQKYVLDPADIEQVIREIEGFGVAFITGIDMNLRNEIVTYCLGKGIKSFITPEVGDVIMAGAEHMQMLSAPLMRVRRALLTPEYLITKRAFDILGALMGILVTSPFMLLTALAIKLSDGGPVLYKQVRLTQDRREFKIWKFRSMCVEAEKDGIARLAGEDDCRITPVGKIIRAIRLDELPQLFNILGGSMSIVGPRPERPEIAEQYEKTMPAFALRLQVKAGLTGYAQICGRYNTEPGDKLEMDLMYINKMSLVEDLRLVFATVKVLFIKESTQGIEHGQLTATYRTKQSSKESA